MRRAIAVDWSGAATGAAGRIWLAEARSGILTRLEGGRPREAVVAALCAEDATSDPVIAGVDFAFSLPGWYLDDLGVDDAFPPWSQIAEHAETWLRDCPPPFWGRPGRRRGPEPQLRLCEQDIAIQGITPKSVFQIGGAGACGTGSLRGIPHLPQLRAAGWSIWPWDAPAARTLVEIWPRTMSGPLRKSDPAERRAWLRRFAADSPIALRRLAADSEDAFDAAASALALSRSRTLPAVLERGAPGDPREGAMLVLDDVP